MFDKIKDFFKTEEKVTPEPRIVSYHKIATVDKKDIFMVDRANFFVTMSLMECLKDVSPKDYILVEYLRTEEGIQVTVPVTSDIVMVVMKASLTGEKFDCDVEIGKEIYTYNDYIAYGVLKEILIEDLKELSVDSSTEKTDEKKMEEQEA